MSDSDSCLDPQLLAAFAERKLKRSEMPAVLAHLERCPVCMRTLKATVQALEEEPRPQQDRRWWAAAAAVVVLIGGGLLVRRTLESTATDRLVRLAPHAARSVEARLTGGFAYAPYRGPMRGTDADAAERMKLVGATGELLERADAENSAAAQHAAGIGLVLVERPEDAIARLRTAAEHSNADAAVWSDLAAAEYGTALQQRRPSLYPAALAHSDAALRIDPNLGEALFNRALILERLGLTQAARAAWDRYLLADPSSKWAEEARAHLKRLPVSTGGSLFEHDQPSLERAAIRGEQATVDAIVDRQPQRCRTWGEAEYLGRWGDAVQHGDQAEASRQLAIARAIGDALVRRSGESLLRDAVNAIDAASLQRSTLAEAHSAYRRARIAYSRGAPAAAEPDLRLAAAHFAQGGSPMALVARYFAANTRFDQNDAATARRELEALRAETAYPALGAQIRWELALCAMLEDDWSASAALFREASDTFRRLGEQSNLAVVQALLGTSLISLGRVDEGWALRSEAYAIQSGEGNARLIALSVGDAARIELRTGHPESAYSLLAIEEAADRAAGDDVQLSNALVRHAVLLDDQRIAREAMTAADRIRDAELRKRAVADARFAEGVAASHTDTRLARSLLGQAIDHYHATGKSFYLPEALLARARASLQDGDRGAAVADLEEGLAEIDRHRATVSGNVIGTGVVDARRSLLDELIPLRLDLGNAGDAFTAAERTHDRLAFTRERSNTAALQQKLAGSDALVLELIVLPREVIAFAVTARDMTVARQPAAREDVIALAARSEGETGVWAARELYDLLIRPSQPAIARVRQLIVVPDSVLQNVPFAALQDRTTNRRLVETMTVATAISAGSLEPSGRSSALPSLGALTLPSGDGRSVALPESESDVAALAGLYRSTRAIDRDHASLPALAEAAGADVVHLGGHTEREPGPGDAALIFRGPDGGIERITWTRIASMKLASSVAVLAACETLRVPPSPRALSLGGGFLAAGIGAVVGTLTPIPDNDARDLFRAVHRELARGRSAVAAVRQAQLEAIAEELHDHRTAWRSVAVLTTRIEREEERQ